MAEAAITEGAKLLGMKSSLMAPSQFLLEQVIKKQACALSFSSFLSQYVISFLTQTPIGHHFCHS